MLKICILDLEPNVFTYSSTMSACENGSLLKTRFLSCYGKPQTFFEPQNV